jgi:ribosome-associated toxin RatA of RatAB toxin-antitoxin module
MQTHALPYDNIPQLLQVLKETFAGDNESVKRATEILQAMANDPFRFIDVMFKIITIERSDGKKEYICNVLLKKL